MEERDEKKGRKEMEEGNEKEMEEKNDGLFDYDGTEEPTWAK